MIDLVLVHPNSRAGNYGPLGGLAAIETPVWAAMLASYVRGKGYSVAIIDAEAEGLDPAEVASRVATMCPRLACVVAYGHHPSASTQVMPAAGATIRAIKEIDGIPTMLLGGHVAALPMRTLQEEEADIVCTGEGPVALARVLAMLRAGGTFSGLTAPAPLVEDLDAEMPEPAWDLLPMDLYRAHNWHALGEPSRSPYASLYTSLGCPFSCNFCCIQAPFKQGERLGQIGKSPARGGDSPNSYRRWSPRRVVDTLEGLAERGVRLVKVADELFVLNRAHVEGVCKEIIRRGLDLNLWAYARTDTVRDGMIPLLRKAGFRWLAFGIESGDAEVRAGSDKAQDADAIEDVIRACRDEGVSVIANYIFGLPGETRGTMQATLDLAGDLNTEFSNFYTAMAYPGSPLYADTLRKRPQDLPRSWSGYSQLAADALPLRTSDLSAKEILAFRDAAFRIYHSSDRYLEMILRTFGEPGVAEVRRMLGVTLERAVR